MRTNRRPPILTSLVLVMVAVLPAQAQPGEQPATPPSAERLAEAPYIVAGTVIGAVRADEIGIRRKPPTDDGATREAPTPYEVRIDHVLLQRGTFSDLTGRSMTVVAPPAGLEAGLSYQLWLEPFRFGKSVVATLVAAEPIDLARVRAGSPGLAEKQTTLARTFADRGLAVRLQAADVVVAGRIESIRPLDRWQAPESEHQPELFEATVIVDQALKGSTAGSRLRFVFATSLDVHWFRAPRVAAGDNGLFLLHRVDDASADLGVETGELTLFHRDDRRATTKLHRVREILR